MSLGGTSGIGGTAGLANLHGQSKNEKDQPGGYAGLDDSGMIAAEELPVLDQLTQLLEAQKQTNELLFLLLIKLNEQGVSTDGN